MMDKLELYILREIRDCVYEKISMYLKDLGYTGAYEDGWDPDAAKDIDHLADYMSAENIVKNTSVPIGVSIDYKKGEITIFGDKPFTEETADIFLANCMVDEDVVLIPEDPHVRYIPNDSVAILLKDFGGPSKGFDVNFACRFFGIDPPPADYTATHKYESESDEDIEVELPDNPLDIDFPSVDDIDD